MAVLKRWAAVAGIPLLLLACGSGSVKTSTSDPSTGTAWIAGHLPDGLVIISAEERSTGRVVGYGAPLEHDYQIAIHASDPSVPLRSGRNPRAARVRGHDATVVTLTDEGNEYGYFVAWEERSDLRVAVEAINGPSEEDALAVAEDVRSIPEADWRVLLIELSLDTHVGRVDPNAVPVEAMRGTIDHEDWVLTVLVPGGFPLGPEDRRLDCFRLSFRGQTSRDWCPGHPVWERVGGQLFVFGDVTATVPRVRVTPLSGLAFEPFTVDTIAIASGPAARFYVAPLPEGACAVTVADAEGSPGPGPTGPLTASGADYTRCTGLQPSDPPRPPATVSVPPPTPTN